MWNTVIGLQTVKTEHAHTQCSFMCLLAIGVSSLPLIFFFFNLEGFVYGQVSLQEEPALPTTDPQNYETICSCCLSHAVSGHLLEKP